MADSIATIHPAAYAAKMRNRLMDIRIEVLADSASLTCASGQVHAWQYRTLD
jgi:hypothetical protein